MTKLRRRPAIRQYFRYYRNMRKLSADRLRLEVVSSEASEKYYAAGIGVLSLGAAIFLGIAAIFPTVWTGALLGTYALMFMAGCWMFNVEIREASVAGAAAKRHLERRQSRPVD